MKTTPLIAGLFCALLSTGAFAANQDADWARGLDLEQAVSSSNLIVVVKVTAVQEIRFMWGGKGGGSVEQYKFKPLRVLKGVFARDELSLMSSDLASYRFGGEIKEIQPGVVLLLFLGRSDVGYANANPYANSWQQSMPVLSNENDPLTDTVKALLTMAAAHEETQRVKILLERLADAQGIDAIPLFTALDRRAWVAAQNPDTAKIVAKHIASANPLVSGAAIEAASQLLSQDYLKNEAMDKELQTALLAALDRQNPDVTLRRALFGALGGLGDYGLKDPAVAAQLDLDKPMETFSEQAARLDAIGKINIAPLTDKVRQYLQKLPLDANSDVERNCEFALCSIAPDKAVDDILARISKKCAAGLDADDEIASLSALPPRTAAETLVKVYNSLPNWKLKDLPLAGQRAFVQMASENERMTFAETCAVVVGKLHDLEAQEHRMADHLYSPKEYKEPMESLVVPLTQFLDPDERARGAAILALMKVDNDDAAKALQPHLTEEQNLYSKLAIAEFLGKHGIADGYPFAIEHMSEPGLLEQAVAALAAIKDPKTVPQLKEILATSNDVAWNSAAIRALGAMGAKDEADKFLEFTTDWKNPLAAPALIALGDLGEIKALPKVREALASHKDEIVIAGARSAAKLLAAHRDAKADDILDKLAALLASSDAGQGVRDAALDALMALGDPRLDKALAAAANDPGFAHTEAFLKTLKEHKIVLPE